VLGRAGPQDLEEAIVADLLPQGLERHGPAPVDRASEHGVPPRIGDDDVPEGITRLAAVVQLEVLVSGADSSVLLPEVLAKLAKPSFSQMWSRVRTDTESPNHRCANSCAIVLVLRTAEQSGRVCVSSAKPMVWPLYVALSAMAPVESNG